MGNYRERVIKLNKMRDIKFRGLSKCKNFWRFGYYTKDSYSNDYIESQNGISVRSGKVHGFSVGQYTGLKDKNGVEIYEGDIVKFHTGVKYVDDQKMNVYFNKGSFGLRNVEHNGISMFCPFLSFENAEKSLADKMDYTFLEQVIEVIGNIHENPELIQN